MKDNTDPQDLGNTIMELRSCGVPVLQAADVATGVVRPDYTKKIQNIQENNGDIHSER
jgi:hypothetical protein